MVSIGDQGVNRGVGDVEILAVGMRAGIPLSVAGFPAAAWAFGLGIGGNGTWDNG